MFDIDLPELTIILVIALVVFGARKLPDIGFNVFQYPTPLLFKIYRIR